MLQKNIFVILLSMLLCQPLSLLAESWQAQSRDKQTAVVELFVAEGCGQCPPAERWSRQLPESGYDTERAIVLTFHIDYLDQQKGWVDRFAKPEYAERQRQMARLNLYQTIFTPEIFIGGEVVHHWREQGEKVIDFINDFDAEADISISAEKNAQVIDIHAQTDVLGDDNRQHSKLYLALTEDNIISEIGGGDNMGAVFNHQNLVRRWLGPFDLNASGHSQIETSVQLERDWKLDDMHLIAFVQNLNDGFVLQGLSMPLAE
jgi:hypothetical protein